MVVVSKAMDARSNCVALARFEIAAAVSLWTSVVLFAWKLAVCAVWADSMILECAIVKSILNWVQALSASGFRFQSL